MTTQWMNIYRNHGGGNITIYQNGHPVINMPSGVSYANYQFNIGDSVNFVVNTQSSGWYWEKLCHAVAYGPSICDNLISIDQSGTVATGIISPNLENVGLYTTQTKPGPISDFSRVPIGVPKYRFGMNIWMNGCGWWQFVPPVEQLPTPQFWDITLNDKDTLELNLNINVACPKLDYRTMYLRFHSATIKNIPIGTQDMGCFWIYKDGQPILNPSIPQYIAAPAQNPINPDWSWGCMVTLLFDMENIKTGLTKYDLVYRGKNPFNPKSLEINIGNNGENIC